MTDATMITHRFDRDEDCCTCGGQIVFFDDPDQDGYRGEGCETGGVWSHLRDRATCELCDEPLEGKGVRMRDPQVWERNPLAHAPSYHVHAECGDAEGWKRDS